MATSLTVLATPVAAATPPAAPASCAVKQSSDGHRVTWTAPVADGGAPITGYRIREKSYSNPVIAVGAAARSASWTTAPRSASPSFTVIARNGSGSSRACITQPAGDDTTPPPPSSGSSELPYTAGSFFKSSVTSAPVDQARTNTFRTFMATHPDQKAISWPKVNMNPDWAMSYHLGKASDPVWRLTGGNTDSERLRIATTQGFHMADSVADTFPTGDQDRPGVMVDPVYGYTVQFADAVVNRANRTINVSNAGIMWHSSNGLDYRNPRSDDDRNFTSRGRILDAMVIRRDLIDRAVANGTGLGHVLHLFFVETNTADGVVHPMTGAESDKAGWGAEGERIRIAPSVNLEARGLTGACLAVARTLQENGAYLGDNSGSSSQLKASQPQHYVGTNLSTDCMQGRVSWNDFEAVERGVQ